MRRIGPEVKASLVISSTRVSAINKSRISGKKFYRSQILLAEDAIIEVALATSEESRQFKVTKVYQSLSCPMRHRRNARRSLKILKLPRLYTRFCATLLRPKSRSFENQGSWLHLLLRHVQIDRLSRCMFSIFLSEAKRDLGDGQSLQATLLDLPVRWPWVQTTSRTRALVRWMT